MKPAPASAFPARPALTNHAPGPSACPSAPTSSLQLCFRSIHATLKRPTPDCSEMQPAVVASSGLRVTPAVQSSGTASRRGAAVIPRVAAPEASPAGDSMELGGETFIRPHLLKLKAYTPIEPFEILAQRLGREPKDIVKLDANENPYGPPPEVLAALGAMAFPNIYPDPESRRLREALAKWNNVPMEHLLVSGAPFALPTGWRRR